MKKIKYPFKAIWNAALGISLELVLVYVFILAGLSACFIWWLVFK